MQRGGVRCLGTPKSHLLTCRQVAVPYQRQQPNISEAKRRKQGIAPQNIRQYVKHRQADGKEKVTFQVQMAWPQASTMPSSTVTPSTRHHKPPPLQQSHPIQALTRQRPQERKQKCGATRAEPMSMACACTAQCQPLQSFHASPASGTLRCEPLHKFLGHGRLFHIVPCSIWAQGPCLPAAKQIADRIYVQVLPSSSSSSTANTGRSMHTLTTKVVVLVV